jgi:formylglycine-generating enzyme required for sulfatase activity
MLKPKPTDRDAILGGQSPPPVNAAVLGGSAGEERLRQKLFDRFGETYKLWRFDTLRLDNLGEIVSSQPRQCYVFAEQLQHDLSLEMTLIPQGSFMMGSEEYYNERPCHLVELSDFHISKYPITQAQYRAVMGVNPSFFAIDDRLPIENVSWNDAQKFCQNLSESTGKKYRLPTEAEWEYVCRAGTSTAFYCGDILTQQVANFGDGYIYRADVEHHYHRQTTPIGSFPGNNFGVYDTHGNVWEWCEDLWHRNYQGAPNHSRAWENGETSSCRVLRGGSWLSDPWFCRSSKRTYLSPESKSNVVGFRVALFL